MGFVRIAETLLPPESVVETALKIVQYVRTARLWWRGTPAQKIAPIIFRYDLTLALAVPFSPGRWWRRVAYPQVGRRMLERLKILTYIPDADCRVRLREALTSIVFKAEIRAVRSLAEAAATLKGEPEIPLLFIASSVGRDAVKKFIEEIAGGDKELSIALIVTVDRHTASKLTAVVQLFMQGVDGFISEPYSPDQLKTLMETVMDPNRVKAVQAASRAVKAVKFLVGDAIRHLDDRWRDAVKGQREGGVAFRELRRLSGELEALHKNHPEEFVSALCTAFEAVPAPQGGAAQLKKKSAKDETPHPGALVSALMHERGLTRERILGIIRMDPAEFDLLVAQKRSIDEMCAREISRALGKTSREWVALQKRYDAANPPNSNPSESGLSSAAPASVAPESKGPK